MTQSRNLENGADELGVVKQGILWVRGRAEVFLEEIPLHMVRKEESVGAAKRRCDGEGKSRNPPVIPAPRWTGDALNRYIDK